MHDAENLSDEPCMQRILTLIFCNFREMVHVDNDIPVFATGSIKYSTAELVQILLDKKRHSGFVCHRQPFRVTESKVFLIDTDKLDHHDDIKADDLGSWKNDGQHS